MKPKDNRVGYVSNFWIEDLKDKTENEKWTRYETMLESNDWFYFQHESAACYEAGIIRNEIIDRLRSDLAEMDEDRADELYAKYCPY